MVEREGVLDLRLDRNFLFFQPIWFTGYFKLLRTGFVNLNNYAYAPY